MARRWVVVAFVVACPGLARAAGLEVLYLDFSDGTENMIQADTDDATRNRTIMGSVTGYPAFTWPGADDDASRQAVIDDVTRQVQDAFAAYDIVVTRTRPVAGPYNMVMIGGDPSVFKMDPRVAGVAYMDCDNRQFSNLVFAFPHPLGGSVHGLFSTISQEAGHALGLQHSSDPSDLMYPRVDVAQRGFQDRETPVASPRYCEGQTQNSHRRLLQLVGPRGEPSPAQLAGTDLTGSVGGCQLGGPRRASRAISGLWGAVLAVFALRACRRRRGRL
jgi:matrixin